MNKKIKLGAFLSATAFLMLFSSCGAQKDFTYLQDMIPEQVYEIMYNEKAVINPDDRLHITVSSKSPALAVPFNAQNGNIEVTDRGEIAASNVPQKNKGYLVNSDGEIDFPVLGALRVGGLTIKELTELIKREIIDGKYIKDPIVNAEFLNFKFYTLGEVSQKGIHSVDGDRITLLEAIAQAGDLTQNARVDKVVVIRKIGDRNQRFVHDLRSKDIFMSPTFYLKQNDIIYVAPKFIREVKTDNFIRYFSLGVSTISAGLTLYLLLTRNQR